MFYEIILIYFYHRIWEKSINSGKHCKQPDLQILLQFVRRDAWQIIYMFQFKLSHLLQKHENIKSRIMRSINIITR